MRYALVILVLLSSTLILKGQNFSDKKNWFCGIDIYKPDSLLKNDFEQNTAFKKKSSRLITESKFSGCYMYNGSVNDNFWTGEFHPDSTTINYIPLLFSTDEKFTKNLPYMGLCKIFKVNYYFNDPAVIERLYKKARREFKFGANWKKATKLTVHERGYIEKGKLIVYENNAKNLNEIRILKKYLNDRLVGLIIESRKS